MEITVFLKAILDPEAPAERFGFQGAGPAASGVPSVLGPFEGNALEAAIRLAEGSGGTFRAVAFGGTEQDAVLRRALALGAATACRVEGQEGWIDPLERARILARAADAGGEADVYVLGRQAGDWDLGVTGGLLAGLLDLPLVPLVREVAVEGGRIWVRREAVGGGTEEGVLRGRAVLTVTNGPGTKLRMPKVRDVMLANRKPIETLLADAPAGGGLVSTGIEQRRVARGGRTVTGDPAEVADALVGELARLGWGGDRA